MKKITEKILSAGLAAGVIASAFVPVAFAQTRFLGDVDNDGAVTTNDALMMLQSIVNEKTDELELQIADMDKDGKVTSNDALQALQTVVGILQPVEIKEEEELPQTKEEIVALYNEVLTNTYASEKVTITKSENTELVFDNLSPSFIKSTVNDIIKKNLKNTTETKTIENSPQTAEEFLVPTKLEAGGAATSTIESTANGYKIKIVLVKEKVDYKTAPKYNSQASKPVSGIAEIVAEAGATINSMNFEYTGTVITAEFNSDKQLLSLAHEMPLKFDADCKLGVNVKGNGSGVYNLTAEFTY